MQEPNANFKRTVVDLLSKNEHLRCAQCGAKAADDPGHRGNWYFDAAGWVCQACHATV